MSSSGLIYAVIVGAWAAYLVPMWLRRQDELNEARPTERFSTAIRLLSGRAGMERRYARDRARSTEEGEPSAEPDGVTDSVDVRAFAMPPLREHTKAQLPVERGESPQAGQQPQQPGKPATQAPAQVQAKPVPQQGGAPAPAQGVAKQQAAQVPAPARSKRSAKQTADARRSDAAEAKARAQRSKVLARRRRTTVMLFLAFTLGAVVAAVGGLAFLWAPGVPAVLLSAYIAHLRRQERKRFAYTMDRRQAEVAAQRLRERQPQRRRPAPDPVDTDEPEDGPESEETRADLSALAADRRALVEQTDHAEWVDQQRERQRHPGQGDSWDPVPVPLPTYVTAPVAPRATSGVDLGAPDAWSSARSSAADPHGSSAAPANSPSASGRATEGDDGGEGNAEAAGPGEAADAPDGGRSDARRAASARRSRERGRTPLFDQYEDGDRPRAANE
ncbi:gephyrin-like molybdotransferase receptor GlpR [Streptomyces scabiei]|uniref:divisome protein SepX/GlpR n=1 Tax=Streptomyces TaxID=1883 RepID=UPI001BFF1B41|nr:MULTISPECIES: gephyrin-like molybdotransferase receptor GlpR [unclassified Streptomyces]